MNKLITLIFAILLLSGCSNGRQGFNSLGSLAGALIATKQGENALVGSIIGGLAGQAIGSQVAN
jgi:hypothetical protein